MVRHRRRNEGREAFEEFEYFGNRRGEIFRRVTRPESVRLAMSSRHPRKADPSTGKSDNRTQGELPVAQVRVALLAD